MAAVVVVCRPRRTRAEISPTRSPSPGSIAFSSDDFPAPLGPVRTLSCPASRSRSAAIPAPVTTDVARIG